MSQLSPVPAEIVRQVDAYVAEELRDAQKFDNREPLDESGVWSLHALVRAIYAQGWDEGFRASAEADRGRRGRSAIKNAS